MPTFKQIEQFITRWKKASGTERANHQLFVSELCALLELPPPDPASKDNAQNAYVFERLVNFHNPDGSVNRGFIDCYRRGSFILEAKATGKTVGSGIWDDAMLRAHGQAVGYARALPKEEGRPPFVMTLDVGVAIELFSEFSLSGGAYVPYPDPRSHRIYLEDLHKEGIRERLCKVWSDPMALDLTRISAKVTRDIASRLAILAKNLEASGHSPEDVAHFLMRAIFTMFAEDVGLLEKNSFTELLVSLKDNPGHFAPMVEDLWKTMNTGGFSTAIRQKLLKFNGGLFRDADALTLDHDQVVLLIDAARADWKQVEPAIFGTLLERALDPHERHKLGAHYTPRAYVERLVLPAVITPLREEWENTKTAALLLDKQGKHRKAVEAVKMFLSRLCQVRILDPACGSGNFLYVTLEHLKRLEGEILNALDQLGETQLLLEAHGLTVDPHQFLGIETNPRAAAIAESVIWIGFLQWHFRTQGNKLPPEPILRDFHNIDNRDAVLAWDSVESVMDESGKAVTRWDGRTYKVHPVTGEQVPDEAARLPMIKYVNPRKAQWPDAEFVVGNPPFIGNKRMRDVLGDGYSEALRKTYPKVPESADFVMYWWHNAADLTRMGKLRRFGLITTNSLRQSFNRRVVKYHMEQNKALSLFYAVPDHPWVDAADGAAVRIAMTVGIAGNHTGRLETVIRELDDGGEGRDVRLMRQSGKIFSDLIVGVDVAGAGQLKANGGLSNRGMIPHGAGFLVSPEDGAKLDGGALLRPYRNGRDLTGRAREVLVIDTFDLSESDLRNNYPATWQWLFDRVKPERDHNKRSSIRDRWWRYAEPRKVLRTAHEDIHRYIATVQTSKHRLFQFLDSSILPDDKLIAIAIDKGDVLGVLSSRIHLFWAFMSGATLEDRPVYNKSVCFDAFPFPDTTDNHKSRISKIAEQIDVHRKRQQEVYEGLTLTGMYNVLEKIRKGEPLTAKEKITHEQGLISVLQQLHDELDMEVFIAYGWEDLSPQLVGRPGSTTPWLDKSDEQTRAEQELLQRLVDLNAQRVAEEQQGYVRWLRPDYQNPEGLSGAQGEAQLEAPSAVKAEKSKPSWPKALPDQVQAIRTVLDYRPDLATSEQIARYFKRAQAKRVREILEILLATGYVRKDEQECYSVI
ncbi:MAG: DNA methyltransferase [Sedimenticola sp.]